MKYRGVEIIVGSEAVILNNQRYQIGSIKSTKLVGDLLLIVKETLIIEMNIYTQSACMRRYSGNVIVSDDFHRNYAVGNNNKYMLYPQCQEVTVDNSLEWSANGWLVDGQLLNTCSPVKVSTSDGLLF